MFETVMVQDCRFAPTHRFQYRWSDLQGSNNLASLNNDEWLYIAKAISTPFRAYASIY